MAADLVVREVHGFLAAALHGRRRVLEVGCGNGVVARQLAATGFDVTALDRELPALQDGANVRFVKHDFLTYDAAPFDAVVFTASLHHIAPLSAVVARTKQLLVPGGLVVADDFDIAAADRETLRWYYEIQELLVAAGSYDADHLDPPNADPVARWHAHHHHLHTGQEMRQALAALGTFAGTRAPYLYRYICGGLKAAPHGARIAAHVLATERARIADGSLCAVGLRVSVQLP